MVGCLHDSGRMWILFSGLKKKGPWSLGCNWFSYSDSFVTGYMSYSEYLYLMFWYFIYVKWFFFFQIQGQKSLALDTAIGMWQLLFAERQWPLVDHWCQFLQVAYWLFLRGVSYIFVFGQTMFFHVFPLMYVFCFAAIQQAKHNKAISRDTWSQLLEFARVRWIFKVIVISLLTII